MNNSSVTPTAQAKHTPMRIGTFSSELVGTSMRLHGTPGASAAAIMDALTKYQPDVLLTAGYSLDDDGDLQDLGGRLNDSCWDGLLFVEVKNYVGDPPHSTTANGEPLSSHCMFAWTRNLKWQRLGRQYFARARQANPAGRPLNAFTQNLDTRVITFRGLRFGAVICGEINALRKLRGTDRVEARANAIEDWFRSLNVIVNPTHDLMGRPGILTAKRRWLSRGDRVYVSASNWNTERNQRRTVPAQHTVFFNGCNVALKRFELPNYEYREGDIPIGFSIPQGASDAA